MMPAAQVELLSDVINTLNQRTEYAYDGQGFYPDSTDISISAWASHVPVSTEMEVHGAGEGPARVFVEPLHSRRQPC